MNRAVGSERFLKQKAMKSEWRPTEKLLSLIFIVMAGRCVGMTSLFISRLLAILISFVASGGRDLRIIWIAC